LIQIGTNFANDYFDYKKGSDTADRTGPVRVTQAGLVAPATMKTATAVVFGLAIVAGIYLVWRGGWPILLVGLLSILFGLLYTGGPFPLGYHGLGEVFVLIFFGPVAVGGTYFVQALEINLPVILAGIAPGLFSVAILTVNNLRDIDNDRSAGKKTLAARFGRRFSIVEYMTCLLVAFTVASVLAFFSQGHRWAGLSALVIPMAVPSMKAVATLYGSALNETLAATGRLLLVFSLLFSIGWMV
jgi:1,4-dihydroxy-2-naphthoate octaprenyltransferase